MTNFSFTGQFVVNLCHKFHKKTKGGIRPKCKKYENTTVFNKQKRTSCVFKCWLNCQLACFEALLSLEKKNIDDPTPPWSAVLFLRLVTHKRYTSKLRDVLCFFQYHFGGTCPVKEFSWSRNGAFWDTEKRPRRVSPLAPFSGLCSVIYVLPTVLAPAYHTRSSCAAHLVRLRHRVHPALAECTVSHVVRSSGCCSRSGYVDNLLSELLPRGESFCNRHEVGSRCPSSLHGYVIPELLPF